MCCRLYLMHTTENNPQINIYQMYWPFGGYSGRGIFWPCLTFFGFTSPGAFCCTGAYLKFQGKWNQRNQAFCRSLAAKTAWHPWSEHSLLVAHPSVCKEVFYHFHRIYSLMFDASCVLGCTGFLSAILMHTTENNPQINIYQMYWPFGGYSGRGIFWPCLSKFFWFQFAWRVLLYRRVPEVLGEVEPKEPCVPLEPGSQDRVTSLVGAFLACSTSLCLEGKSFTSSME